jgi:hypothetical protein
MRKNIKFFTYLANLTSSRAHYGTYLTMSEQQLALRKEQLKFGVNVIALCQTTTALSYYTHNAKKRKNGTLGLAVSFAIFMQKLFTRLVCKQYSFYGFIIRRGTCV